MSEFEKNGEKWKVDMFSPETTFEVIEIGQSVEVELADKEHPIGVVADGWMSLKDAKRLVAEIQEGIDICEGKKTKEPTKTFASAPRDTRREEEK